jgi:hypothetical protein
MLGHRGLWKDGWKAVTPHKSGRPFEKDDWELYHLDRDFSETDNLAAAEPERLKAMVDEWWREAEKNGVLPLDDRNGFELFRASRRPGMPTSRRRFTYFPPISHLVADACPPVFRGWTMSFDVHHVDGGEGALVSRGSINSGFVLYVQGGRCAFDFNAFHEHTLIVADKPLAAGDRRVEVDVERQPDGSGKATLKIDGDAVGSGVIPRLLIIVSSLGMDIGRSMRPVSNAYEAPFAYPGLIRSAVFEVAPLPPEFARMVDRAEVATAMSRQ